MSIPPGAAAPWAEVPGGKVVNYQRSTFGDPITDEELSVVEALPSFQARMPSQAEVPHVTGAVLAAAKADAALFVASGRWQVGRPDPERFVPGDVAMLRYVAVDPSLRRLMEIHESWHEAPGLSAADRAGLLWHTRRLGSLLRTVQTAQAYFLPVTSAQAILASTPPDDELAREVRLPAAQCAVYFGADLAIPPALARWPAGLDASRVGTRALLERIRAAAPAGSLAAALGAVPATDLTITVRDRGGYLTGVVLLAEADGQLADEVIWLATTNPDPLAAGTASLDRTRGIIDGYLPASTLAPLARNLAAAVCWGAWSPPAPGPPLPEAEPDSKAWRRAWKSGAVKRAERRGAFAGVRVIDLAKMSAPPRRHADAGAGPARKLPRPHNRRGHWRRSRVGPREGWHYEGRWIPGRKVALGNPGPDDDRPVVYRLPVPPGPDREEER